MSSGPPVIPPGITDQNRGGTVVAIFWTQVAVACLIMAGRFWARLLIHRLGADDWLMLFTLVLFIVWTILLTIDSNLGGFRHIYFLTQEQGLQILKINYMVQVFIIFAYVTAKASVGFLVLRIMGPNSVWRKYLIYAVMILTAIVGSLDCIFTYVQCDPPEALWNPSIPHTCWDPSIQTNFAIFTSSENIFADVVLAFVPVSIIYGLNMNLQKRISLCILLGLGLAAAVCGIIKTTFLASLSQRTDLTWATYDLIVWSGAELFVILVCGSIPPLKTLWDRFIAKQGYMTYGNKSAVGAMTPSNYNRSRLQSQPKRTLDSSDSDTQGLSANQIHAMTNIEVIHTKADTHVDPYQRDRSMMV